MVTPEQFRQHAADVHRSSPNPRVPVVREVLSDLDTPLSVYLKLADAPHTYLLESVEGGERFGRYSIIGLPARRTVAFRGHAMEVREHGQVVMPVCPFFAAWFQKHPDQADVVHPTYRGILGL